MSMTPYRPGPTGLEQAPVELRTWRSRLRSRRWKPAPLSNPEMQPTGSRMAVIFWLALGVLTFFVLVVGYGIGFWGTAAA